MPAGLRPVGRAGRHATVPSYGRDGHRRRLQKSAPVAPRAYQTGGQRGRHRGAVAPVPGRAGGSKGTRWNTRRADGSLPDELCRRSAETPRQCHRGGARRSSGTSPRLYQRVSGQGKGDRASQGGFCSGKPRVPVAPVSALAARPHLSLPSAELSTSLARSPDARPGLLALAADGRAHRPCHGAGLPSLSTSQTPGRGRNGRETSTVLSFPLTYRHGPDLSLARRFQSTRFAEASL